MNKFIYSRDKGFKNTPYCHACDIKQTGSAYDVIIRGIIINKPRVVYIRLNDFSVYQGLEYKRVIYQFKTNLKACEAYLKRNFRGFKLYDSLTINKLPYNIQREILNS